MKQKQLYSFDIFDTLLAQKYPTGHTVTEHLWNELGGRFGSGVPFRVREAAKCAADERLQWSTTLEDVYRELLFIVDGRDANSEALLRSEIANEISTLYPIPENVERLRTARENGYDVVFVSDMHMREGHLREILEHFGLWQEGDRLFVSCDYGTTKAEGLFERLIEENQFSPGRVIHVGNSYESDIQPAENAGLRTLHVARGNNNTYENILNAFEHDTMGSSVRLAGSSRYARLNVPCKTPCQAAVRIVAAGVLAPVLVSFVLWALHRADQEGVRRLYFSSRSGPILYHIARRLVNKGLDVPCELRYLYVSRAALGCASPEGDDEDVARAVPGEVDARLGEPAELVLAYLQQEGLTEVGRSGIIDIGWTGSIHATLNHILESSDDLDENVWGGFFGLTLSEHKFRDSREAFFFDENLQVGWNPLERRSDIRSLLRAFCPVAHGSVLGYRRNSSDQIDPRLGAPRDVRRGTSKLDVIQQTIDRFLDAYVVDKEAARFTKILRLPLARVIQSFWRRPGLEEAKAWGTSPLGVLPADESGGDLARAYAWSDLITFARYGMSVRRKSEGYPTWHEGSLALSSGIIAYILRTVLRIKTRLGRVIQGRNI
jgi:FMN phosphatase YigB (HAD superfamily)